MKNLDYYQARSLKTPSAVFQHFVETITANNRTWDYFINWNKVYANVDQLKIELNILNSLCDSNDFDSDLRNILSRYPEVVQAFPMLIGVRDSQLSVLEKRTLPEFVFRDFDFRPSPFNENTIDDYVSFVSNSGLKSLFLTRSLSNLKDYSTGVEVGLDTNGRKNRGGTLMENLVQNLLEDVYHLGPNDYSSQASPSSTRQMWGIELPVDKSSRRPDFLIH
jgi:type II restriction enzyme